MSLADPLPITPFTRPCTGSVTLPGSKSITNRALILGALADGPVTLHGALFSRDTRIMVTALRQLGFAVATDEKALTIRIEGRNGEIPNAEATIHVGNAGTAALFLTAFVCLRQDGIYHFDGDEAMRARPIGTLLDALESQGAQADSRSFPFTLRTASLPGGKIAIDASASSQLVSALLLVASKAESPLQVELIGETVSKPFVTITQRMVEQFSRPQRDYAVEGDATAASYFAALPVATRGRVGIGGLNLSPEALQGDREFCHLLSAQGLVRLENTTAIDAGGRKGFTSDFNAISDTFLTLAAIAPLLDGPTKITGIAHTRKQETDRVAGMARELTKLGQRVIETEDSLEIHPQPLKTGQVIETYHDHRFAMSFGVLGCHDLQGNGQPWLSIKDPACCAKTFPHFFDVLETLRQASLRS